VKDRLAWQSVLLSETSTCSSIVAKWRWQRKTRRICAFWSTGRTLRICRRFRLLIKQLLKKAESTPSYYSILFFYSIKIYIFSNSQEIEGISTDLFGLFSMRQFVLSKVVRPKIPARFVSKRRGVVDVARGGR
jgi:hypothetical protein